MIQYRDKCCHNVKAPGKCQSPLLVEESPDKQLKEKVQQLITCLRICKEGGFLSRGVQHELH